MESKRPLSYGRRCGFTLIELLIVVAIISVLSAIAVPNFLEAQVRSKVARVHGDIHTLRTAIGFYYTDHGTVPFWRYITPTFLDLTTPIAYIASEPLDPFLPVNDYPKPQQEPDPELYPPLFGTYTYLYGVFFDQHSDIWAADAPPELAYLFNSLWAVGGEGLERFLEEKSQGKLAIIGSAGPNRVWTDDVYCYRLYDCTNGTISAGAIWFTWP